jgi:carboxypeptidase family protein/TonB-dependent receptor-like protein
MKFSRIRTAAFLVLCATDVRAQGTAAAAFALMCPDVRDTDVGVIVGRVRDVDDGSALESATVSTDWIEYTITNGKSDSRRVRADIKTKSDGTYLLCGVPIKVPLEIQAEWNGRVVGPSPVQLDDRLIGRLEFAVSKRDSATTHDSTSVSGSATLRGVVRGADGKPLREAAVSVMGTARSARTDGKGAFTLDHIPAGTRSIEAKSVGLLPTRISIEFATGIVRDTTITLTRTAQQLKAVAVDATAEMAPLMVRSGFNERRAQAMAAFITEQDLAKHAYTDLVSVLQGVRGVHVERGAVSRSQSGIAQPMAYMKGVVSLLGDQPGQNCIPNYFVDGVQYQVKNYRDFSDLSLIAQPETIHGVEIYSNPGTIPAQYDLMSSTGCGSIVIWTR